MWVTGIEGRQRFAEDPVPPLGLSSDEAADASELRLFNGVYVGDDLDPTVEASRGEGPEAGVNVHGHLVDLMPARDRTPSTAVPTGELRPSLLDDLLGVIDEVVGIAVFCFDADDALEIPALTHCHCSLVIVTGTSPAVPVPDSVNASSDASCPDAWALPKVCVHPKAAHLRFAHRPHRRRPWSGAGGSQPALERT